MNYNSHSRTKQFRNIGAIVSTILLCFCCTIEAKEKGVYYNLTEALQHPTDVQYLYLEASEGGNQLTTLPEEIGNLQNLQTLNLNNNQLTTLPKEIGKLQKLKWLDLSGNPSLIDQEEKIRKLLPNVNLYF
ncbi:leucine rich repeat protein [Leptospira santarosai str. 2000030832]|nr:leucine-rich repeat domain-containing protein [Leptospira santarosai]EMM78569.1 leucine rich repeat protein [Leptospira santarosai str. 2000030832]